MKGFNLYFKLLLYEVLFCIVYIVFCRKLNILFKKVIILEGLNKNCYSYKSLTISLIADLMKLNFFYISRISERSPILNEQTLY